MPPRVEVDSHAEDGLQAQSSSNDEEAPSPLFRDNSAKFPPPSSSLDRRQSDPHFAGKDAASLTEEPAKKPAAQPVSKITAIIGPESAYVKTTTGESAPAPAAKAPTPAQQTKPTTAAKTPSTQSGAKIEPKPLLLRARRFVKKKGWRAVPKKFASWLGQPFAVPGRM